MKSRCTPILLAGALIGALASALAFAQVPTTGSIDSRIGKLEVVNGYPTDATVKAPYDARDFQHSVQAYLWALPHVAMGQWQDEQRSKSGETNFGYVFGFDFCTACGAIGACG